MKRMMSSSVTSPLQSPTAMKRETSVESNASSGNRLRVPQDMGRSGVESEEDWTGTGDDWTGTGASSDSGFINFIRTRQENGYFQGHPMNSGLSPLPPVPPKGPLLPIPQDGECHYMNLTSSTMDQDNQYVTINSKELLAQHAAEFRHGGRFADYQQPRMVGGVGHMTSSTSDDLTSSFTDEEGYCRMVPQVQRSIARNSSLPNSRPPAVPPHKKQSLAGMVNHPAM